MHIYFIYPPFVLHMYIYTYIYIFLSKTDFVCVNPSGKALKLAMPLGAGEDLHSPLHCHCTLALGATSNE